MVGKYFQAVGALNAANKVAQGEEQVIHRAQSLKDKLAGVQMRSDLKEIVENALKQLEVVQNGVLK